MRKVLVAFTLAFLSSMAWVAWSAVSDVLLIGNKADYVYYLAVIYVIVLLLSTAIMVYYTKTRNKFRKKEIGYLPYAALAGVVFGVGTIIFFGLLGNASYPFVATVQVSAIVPYAFFITLITKERPKSRYYLGTIIVLLGFVLQVFGIYGSNISAAIPTIVSSAAVLLLYTLGYLLSFYFVYNGLHPLKAAPAVSLSNLLVVLAYLFFTEGYGHASRLTAYDALLLTIVGIAVVAGYLLEELPINMLKNAGVKYLNTANLLSSFETPGILIFSAVFLSLLYLPLIAGLLLTFAGIVLVVYS